MNRAARRRAGQRSTLHTPSRPLPVASQRALDRAARRNLRPGRVRADLFETAHTAYLTCVGALMADQARAELHGTEQDVARINAALQTVHDRWDAWRAQQAG